MFWIDFDSFRANLFQVTLFLKFKLVFACFLQNQSHTSFLSPFIYYLVLGPNKKFWVDFTHFEISLARLCFSLYFSYFSYTLHNTKHTHHFCLNFFIILSWDQIRSLELIISLLSPFCKVTLFLMFRSNFVHFPQYQTHALFLSLFLYYLVLGPNKGYWIDSKRA